MVGIAAFGAYIPRSRLQRASVAAAHAWFNPALKGLGRGERAMAGWDEDSVTMAVEAARDCFADRPREVATLLLATTTAPYLDRQNAGIVKEALNLPDTVATADLGGSQRAGISALIAAIRAAERAAALCLAADKRIGKPGSETEMQSGDAAAAILLGPEDGIARYLADASITADFVDHFRGAGEEFDYGWEARWVREEGFGKLAPQAIRAVLETAGLQGADIDHFILPSTARGASEGVAKACKIKPEAVRDQMASSVGEAGCAHPLLMLAAALEAAKPGERILAAAFGSGCEAVLFERTAAEAPRPLLGVSGWLARKKAEPNYMKYLAFNRLIDLERGMRAEMDQKQPLSALWRQRKTVLGLVGGRCTKTGTVQFPKTDIGVNPNDHAVGTQEDYPLADRRARILTHTADSLTYTPDPPGYYGMVEFEEGGRMSTEFCDVDPEDVEVGKPVRMMFRIKAIDEQRGFRKYFWKAAPAR